MVNVQESKLAYRAEWSTLQKRWVASVLLSGRIVQRIELPRCGQAEAIRSARALRELYKLREEG